MVSWVLEWGKNKSEKKNEC
jgi:hypothetical protein